LNTQIALLEVFSIDGLPAAYLDPFIKRVVRERFPSKNISSRPTDTDVAIPMQIVRHLQGADAIASLIEFDA
jgi:hypothetical protein